VQIAILIYRYRLIGTNAELTLRLVGQIDTLTAMLGLEIYEGDMVLGQHRVCHATYLNLDLAIVEFCDYREMLLTACIDCASHQLLHLLAAAYYCNARIYALVENISTMFANIKLCCHNFKKLL
jgi:hypothetical protein